MATTHQKITYTPFESLSTVLEFIRLKYPDQKHAREASVITKGSAVLPYHSVLSTTINPLGLTCHEDHPVREIKNEANSNRPFQTSGCS
jgi:hypothetical protein